MAREKALRAQDVMTTSLVVLDVRTTIEVATRILAERRISGAPVISPSGAPLGMVTRADLLDPRHDRQATVDAAMTRVLYGVRPTDPAMAAVRLMNAERIHRVVVVDASGKLVGLVTSMDVMRVLAQSEPDDGVAMEWVAIHKAPAA